MSETLQVQTQQLPAPDLARSSYWNGRAEAGYNKLGWVSAKSLLEKMVDSAQLKGDERVLDVGTGTGAVLDAVAARLDTGLVIGLDISYQMLQGRTSPLPPNARLGVGDVYDLPVFNARIDVITARQVYHNLGDIDKAVREAFRVLKPGGRLVICEYVPQDEDTLKSEQPVWNIKEPGRNLWTAEQMKKIVAASWDGQSVEVDSVILPQYSNKDWMRRSGLSDNKQEAILNFYLAASAEMVKRMNITSTEDGDTLVDRPFAFAIATK